MEESVEIWYSIRNDGAGAAYLRWFLTEAEAEADQYNMDEGWGEPCFGMIETYYGSNIYKEATKNSKS